MRAFFIIVPALALLAGCSIDTHEHYDRRPDHHRIERRPSRHDGHHDRHHEYRHRDHGHHDRWHDRHR